MCGTRSATGLPLRQSAVDNMNFRGGQNQGDLDLMGKPVVVSLFEDVGDHFIKTGEKIKIDTRTGKYMERA